MDADCLCHLRYVEREDPNTLGLLWRYERIWRSDLAARIRELRDKGRLDFVWKPFGQPGVWEQPPWREIGPLTILADAHATVLLAPPRMSDVPPYWWPR